MADKNIDRPIVANIIKANLSFISRFRKRTTQSGLPAVRKVDPVPAPYSEWHSSLRRGQGSAFLTANHRTNSLSFTQFHHSFTDACNYSCNAQP